MSLSNAVGSYSGCDTSHSQIVQLDCDAEEVEGRLCRLVGEVLVKAGKNMQLLQFEQMALKKENTELKNRIVQLKMVYVAEWQATLEDYNAKMSVVSDKIRAIVERFRWVKEYFVDAGGQQLLDNVKNFYSSGLKENFYRVMGAVQVREEMDACLADKGCDSVYAKWLKLTSEKICAELVAYPEYPNTNGGAGQASDQILDQKLGEIPTQGLTTAIAHQTDLMVRKFARPRVGKYPSLENATAIMVAANSTLIEEKELMIKFHSRKVHALKCLFTFKFAENLEKARAAYGLTEKSIHSTDKFSHATDPLSEPLPLTDAKLKQAREGYIEEAKLIQGLVRSLISTLEAFIADYELND